MSKRSQTASLMLLGCLSGLALAAPHLLGALAPLQAVSLLPLLWGLASRRPGPKAAAAAGALLGLFYGLPQVLTLKLPLSIGLGFAVYFIVLMALFALGSALLLRTPSVASALAVGALFAGLDWANFTALPMWGTAQSFVRPWSVYPRAVEFSAYTGITGIAFAVAAAQALLALVVARPVRRLRPAAALVLLLSLLAAADVAAARREPVGTLRVAAVGWTRDDARRLGGLKSAEGFETLYASAVAEAAAQGATLVVSPETAFTLDDALIPRLRQAAADNAVYLFAGYWTDVPGENRLLFLGPDGDILADYTKTHLTPFEKYRRGTGKLAFAEVQGYRVGGMICQDDNFSDLARGYGRESTALVVVPTNDWAAVKEAHFQSSLHRALDCRYAVVRAATNGISAVVAPGGRVVARMDHIADGPGFLVADVPLRPARTLFSRLGHWPAALGALWLAGLGLRRLLRFPPVSGIFRRVKIS